MTWWLFIEGRGFLNEPYQPGITEMVPGFVSGGVILEEVERISLNKEFAK